MAVSLFFGVKLHQFRRLRKFLFPHLFPATNNEAQCAFNENWNDHNSLPPPFHSIAKRANNTIGLFGFFFKSIFIFNYKNITLFLIFFIPHFIFNLFHIFKYLYMQQKKGQFYYFLLNHNCVSNCILYCLYFQNHNHPKF